MPARMPGKPRHHRCRSTLVRGWRTKQGVIAFAALLILGLLLIALETVVPGGVLGVLGVLCIVAAVLAGYFVFDASTANGIFLAVVVAFLIGGLLWLRYFPQSRLGQRFAVQNTVGNQGFNYDHLVGKRGVTVTPLRPSGTIKIDEQRWDVLTDGSYVEVDQPVEVVQVDGNRILVRELPQERASQA